MSRITKSGYKFELTKIIQGLTRYTEIDEIMTRLAEFEDAEEVKNKGCDFCNSHEHYLFYAGYSQQLDFDKFDERETEEVNFCPVCGKPLKEDNT